jgi:hypothetical protein
VEQQKILWRVSQIDGKNNTKFGKLFPTCGTTKTSLSILSWINNASNKNLESFYQLVEQQQIL